MMDGLMGCFERGGRAATEYCCGRVLYLAQSSDNVGFILPCRRRVQKVGFGDVVVWAVSAVLGEKRGGGRRGGGGGGTTGSRHGLAAMHGRNSCHPVHIITGSGWSCFLWSMCTSSCLLLERLSEASAVEMHVYTAGRRGGGQNK